MLHRQKCTKDILNCTTSPIPNETHIFIPLFKSLNPFSPTRNNSEARM